MREIPCCFECWPGGPVTPPPCRRCGSKENYYTSGLCARCHLHAPGPKSPRWESPGKLRRRPIKVASCPDCLAWGVTARYGWMCVACKSWREKYGTDGQCITCGRNVPVSPDGSCRLCHKHRNLAARLLGRRISIVTLAEANAHGQQLFIAGTWRPAGTIRREYVKKTVPADMSLLRPVAHRQLVLFDMPRDLRLGLWDKFPPPPDPALEAAFAQFVADHAAAHGWTKGYTATIQRGIRIMLGIQDTPGAPIRRSDILLLTRIKHSAATVTEVIAAAGMLEDDIEPPVVRWFHAKTAALPEQMRRELGVWLEVMRNGSTTPPRSKPRSDETIRAQLAFALPVLQLLGRRPATRCARSAAPTCSPPCRPPASPAPPRCRACGRSSASCEPASWSSPTPPSASTSPPRPWRSRPRSTWPPCGTPWTRPARPAP